MWQVDELCCKKKMCTDYRTIMIIIIYISPFFCGHVVPFLFLWFYVFLFDFGAGIIVKLNIMAGQSKIIFICILKHTRYWYGVIRMKMRLKTKGKINKWQPCRRKNQHQEKIMPANIFFSLLIKAGDILLILWGLCVCFDIVRLRVSIFLTTL